MNSYIDILSYFKNNSIENSEKFLKDFVIKSYNKVRENSSSIDEVYNECQNILYDLFSVMSNITPFVRYRMISLISLKNNITIQKEITKEKLDLFYSELMYFSREENIVNSESTIFKVITSLAQIQYGYNILKLDISLKNDYEKFITIFEKNIDIIYSYYINKKSIDIESYELSMIYSYSSLFEKNISNMVLEKILFCWKIPKIKNKPSSHEAEFSDLNKYDFIY